MWVMNVCFAAGSAVFDALDLRHGMLIFILGLDRGTVTAVHGHSIFHFTNFNRLLDVDRLHFGNLFVLELSSEIRGHRICHDPFDGFTETWLFEVVLGIDIAES